MAKGSSKIDNRNADYEAVVKQRRIFSIFIFLSAFVMAMGIVDFILDGNGDYGDYFWFDPFSKNDAKSIYYFNNYLALPIIMFSISVVMWIFHFGNPKKKYIQTLESIKQSIISFVPFYFDGHDDRNLYIRFGFKYSVENNFLKRKVHQKEYLKKVSHLTQFIGDYSPHKIFEVNTGNSKNKKTFDLKISSRFTNELMFLELFKIVEGYLVSNIDIFMNITLRKYTAIGNSNPKFTKESFKFFSHHNYGEEKAKKFNKELEELFLELEKKKITEKEFRKKALRTVRKYSGTNGITLYENSIHKMVLFSPCAIKEAVDNIYLDSKRYFNQIKLFENKVYERIMEYGKIDEHKLLSYMSFVYFYKLINNFMGLPSGIVSARLKDYDLQRIIDDIDHFSESRSVRQVVYNQNDKKGKYDDTFARSFMIFYHEYNNNSFNNSVLSEIFANFDPLRNVDSGVTFSFNGFGSYDESLRTSDEEMISESYSQSSKENSGVKK